MRRRRRPPVIVNGALPASFVSLKFLEGIWDPSVGALACVQYSVPGSLTLTRTKATSCVTASAERSVTTGGRMSGTSTSRRTGTVMQFPATSWATKKTRYTVIIARPALVPTSASAAVVAVTGINPDAVLMPKIA